MLRRARVRRETVVCPLLFSEREEVEAFLEAVDADDDVQNVYVGLAG